jgi:hypothetical protein
MSGRLAAVLAFRSVVASMTRQQKRGIWIVILVALVASFLTVPPLIWIIWAIAAIYLAALIVRIRARKRLTAGAGRSL